MALSLLSLYTTYQFEERKRVQVMSEGGIKTRIINRLSRTRFVREAMAEKTTLSSLRVKPTLRFWTGLGLIGVSYVIGWPAVGLLALIAFHMHEPLIVAIGGPIIYGVSHLAFLAGSYLAGSRYVKIFLHGATRRIVEKWGNTSPLNRGSFKGTFSLAHGVGFTAFLLSGVLLLFGWKIAAIPLALYVLSCLVFPFIPWVSFFLPVISRGRRDFKAVALTFDDGPDPDVIFPLLNLLDRYKVAATFFVIGEKAEETPDLVREILVRGHAIGNHTYHHDPLLMLRSNARLAWEIARTQLLLAHFGIRPLVFRPPVGITNPKLFKILRELQLDCVTFSCRARDFGNRRIAKLATIVMKKIHPGAIVLLHDVSPRGGGRIMDWLYEVEQLIMGLKSCGYEIVPLSELIGRPVMELLSTDPPKQELTT
jgi:peptidoglycan-N-acetylglucosamine deacetylase